MTSERLSFQPSEVSTPDTATGGGSSRKIEPQIPQQGVAYPSPNIRETTPSSEEVSLPDNALPTSSIVTEAVSHTTPVTDTHSPQDPWAELRKARQEKWEETGHVPPIAGGASDKPEGSEERKGELVDLSNQPESVDCHSTYLDMKGINWKTDLSPEGQWLFKELLIGAEDIQLLEKYAQADGIDLDAAIKELDQYNFIDRSEPDFFHLPWQKIPPQG